MSKVKTKVAADASGVSSTNAPKGEKPTSTECNQENEKGMCQNTNPISQRFNGKSPDEIQKRLQSCYRLFVDIASGMIHGEPCLALIVKNLCSEYLAENEVYMNYLKTPVKQIISDADTIMNFMCLMRDNDGYAKEHEKAAKVVAEIMSRYAPYLQKVWAEYVEKENSK